MEQAEKEFLKRMIEAGIELPTSNIIKNDEIDLGPQPQFIKNVVKALEKRTSDETSAKTFQESLTVENHLDQEFIAQFIPSDLLDTNMFVGRNVSEYQWFFAGSGIKSFLKDSLQKVDDYLTIQIETSTQVHFKLLSWYKNTFLIRLSDETWSESNLNLYYLISDEKKLYRLNGTSPPIHELNAKTPIQLNQHNAIDYLMFFCFFVRGEEGPFYIIENSKDPFLPENEEVENIIKSVVHKANAPTINENNNFHTRVVIYYSNAIFEAQFAIQPSGMVEMLDDEPIAADLPVTIEYPIAYSHPKNSEED